ncbi:MAG: hemolysin family protein [Treponema sp.]|nr:hemolysin family protein [Treponema sp.]
MPDGAIPLFVSIIVLICFSAFFSATETAYTCASRIKLKSLSSSGSKRAGKVLSLTEKNYDKLLSTILIGNNIVNISASTLSALFFAILLANSSLNSSVVSTAAITVAVLIFGEITPKYIGKAYAEKLAMFVYPVLSVLIFTFTPLNVVFSGWKNLIVKIFRFDSKNVIAEEEIMTMVEEAEEDGTLKEHERNFIRSVIEFDDLNVEDIIIPRVNIFAVEKNSSYDEIKQKFAECGFSRLPVYDGEIDCICGILHEKDFFKACPENFSLEKIIQKPFFSTGKTKISKLLFKMQKERFHMAVILDEYGGTLGLVTMEDILEELVGEIYDEHDAEVENIKPCGNGCFIVSGETSMHKLLKFFGIKEADEFSSNTVSGWITETLGDFPEKGCKIDFNGRIEFEVLKVEDNLIREVKASQKIC